MIFAEFNPTILFLILWGLLSWFTKNKKNKSKKIIQGENSDVIPDDNLFSRLQELKDHLSNEPEIFPSDHEAEEIQKRSLNENNEYGLEKPKIFEPDSVEVDKDERFIFETDIKIPTTRGNHWLKKKISQKSELRKFMVLKEVLGDPRSLKPYTGDYFIHK